MKQRGCKNDQKKQSTEGNGETPKKSKRKRSTEAENGEEADDGEAENDEEQPKKKRKVAKENGDVTAVTGKNKKSKSKKSKSTKTKKSKKTSKSKESSDEEDNANEGENNNGESSTNNGENTTDNGENEELEVKAEGIDAIESQSTDNVVNPVPVVATPVPTELLPMDYGQADPLQSVDTSVFNMGIVDAEFVNNACTELDKLTALLRAFQTTFPPDTTTTQKVSKEIQDTSREVVQSLCQLLDV